MKRKVMFMVMAVGLATLGSAFSQTDPFQDFAQYCAQQFHEQGQCPVKICELKTVSGQGQELPPMCVPRPCTKITSQDCPTEFCEVMIDCSQEKICHYKMYGERPTCGDLAYAGQDVDCCQGLVKRCGVEFVDGNCDMEGKNSVYNLPICIPCGDGVCTNFESHCNCPEDCKAPPVTE